MDSFLQSDDAFSTRFFRQALLGNTLSHGYVLKGKSPEPMYRLALEVAKALNCEQPQSAVEPCGVCTNCKWIAGNAHPAVWTVSRLTFLVGEQGKELSIEDLEKLSKKPQQTQIRTDQIGRLVQQLGVSSPYYRVVIFTDADELPASENAPQSDVDLAPPFDWAGISGNEKKRFVLKPLHRNLFNAESANRFLKTLEEPSPRTLFFFLTDSEDNLLETIVSRCQCVPFVTAGISHEMGFDSSDNAKALYGQWLIYFLSPQAQPPRDVYPLIQEFQNVLISEEGFSPEQALSGFSAFLRQEYAQGGTADSSDATPPPAHSGIPFERYRTIQLAIEQAIRLLQSKTNPEQTLQQFFWQLASRPEPSGVFASA